MESEGWLDYVPLQSSDFIQHEDTEELLCFRKRGRGRVDHRVVPRLPLRAMIQKMKLLDESVSSSGLSVARGRARLLQDRARSGRPHGLVKKKEVMEKPKVKREIVAVDLIDKDVEPSYNQQWKQTDFPNIGKEHTTEGSPKKKCRSIVSETQEHTEANVKPNEPESAETEQLVNDLPTKCSLADEIQHLSNETKIVKSKVHKKEKFDFRKANQKLLQEFPVAKSGPKVLSLTQHNLEKFLRESDSESSCSSQDIKSNNVSQEYLDNLPLYERYAVTLDDIKKSKSAKDPPVVKGQLANLLEAMDSYCENPEKYFDNLNKTSKESGEMPGNNKVLSSKNIESVVSNVSVVSDMSDLNSPSENIDNNDNSMEGVDDIVNNEKTGVDVGEAQNSITKCGDVGNDLHKCNKEIINIKENGSVSMADSCDLPKNVEFKSSDGNEELLTKYLIDENQSDKQNTKDDISGLERIDLFSKPKSPSFDNQPKNDLNEFQKVVYKQSKKKLSPKCAKRNLSSTPSEQSVWRIYAPNAIQVDGLPLNCDISELQGMVAGFGAVLDFQVRTVNTGTSVRFKLRGKDACEFAVQCLDDTDCLFPESNHRLSCHQLHT